MKRVDFPWTLVIAVLAVIATAWGADLLVADAERVRDGQVWRLITGPFVHATWGHLARDLCVGGIAGIAYEQPMRRWWPMLCGLALVIPAALVILDGAAGYGGLSGVSHAFIAAALAFEVRRRRGRARAYVLALAAIGAVKIGYELITGAPAFPMDLGPGVQQAPLAHAAGVVVGAIVGLQAARSRAGSGGARTPSTSDAASWPDDQPTCAQ
jgi:rhomboid family GlyGly-CTERM serine protease